MTQPSPTAYPMAPPDLPSRLQALQQNGHGYLDPTAQAALAAAPTSPNNSDQYPAEQARQVTAAFRDRAVAFAEKDPSFLRFWNDSLRYAFGLLAGQA